MVVWWHSCFVNFPTSLSVPVTLFASGLCGTVPGAKWFKTTATLLSQAQTVMDFPLIHPWTENWIWQMHTPAARSCSTAVLWPFILEHKEEVCSWSFQHLKWQAQAYTAGCFLCHHYSILTCFLQPAFLQCSCSGFFCVFRELSLLFAAALHLSCAELRTIW